MKPEFTKLNPVERARKYIFPGGREIEFYGVHSIAVSASGTHRLETNAGQKIIVPTGWLAIILDVDDWTM